MDNDKQKVREQRYHEAIADARRTGKGVSYLDDDGCEITVTPNGHIFYNAVDWY